MRGPIIVLSLAVLISGVVVTQTISAASIKGSVMLEGIAYVDEPKFSDQRKTGVYSRLSGELKGKHDLSSSGDLSGQYELRFSADEEDLFGDVKKAALYWTKGPFQLRGGMLQERWGVMTTYSPADIFNQSDMVEDLDNSERLGQPAVVLEIVDNLLDVSVLVSPGGRERRLAEGGRRYRILPFDFADAVFEDEDGNFEDGQETLEHAARLGLRTGFFGLNFMYFEGHSREPEFTPVLEDGVVTAFTPTYKRIKQSAMTLEVTLGDYVLRGEGILRSGQTGKAFTGYSAGVERLFYGVAGTSSDMLVYTEYFNDERPEGAPVTLFDNDIALGVQWIMNDPIGEIAARVIYDVDTYARLWMLEYQQSLSDSTVLEAAILVPSGVANDSALSSMAKDSEIRLGVRWLF